MSSEFTWWVHMMGSCDGFTWWVHVMGSHDGFMWRVHMMGSKGHLCDVCEAVLQSNINGTGSIWNIYHTNTLQGASEIHYRECHKYLLNIYYRECHKYLLNLYYSECHNYLPHTHYSVWHIYMSYRYSTESIRNINFRSTIFYLFMLIFNTSQND